MVYGEAPGTTKQLHWTASVMTVVEVLYGLRSKVLWRCFSAVHSSPRYSTRTHGEENFPGGKKKVFVSQNTTQMSCLPAISSVPCVRTACCVFECASVCDRGPNLNGDCPFCSAVTAKHPGNLRGPQTKQTPLPLSDFLSEFLFTS